MEGLLETLVDSPWVYLLVGLAITGSAVFPPLPSEGMLLTALGLAAAGELSLGWVCVATWTGAWCGDALAYGVGRLLSGAARREAGSSSRARAALGWLEEREQRWGPGLILGGRFVPGGTTAVGISAGLLGFPLKTFLAFAAIGAALWTGYGAAIAFLGDRLFPDNLWASLVLAVILVLIVSAAVHRVARRRRTSTSSPSPQTADTTAPPKS